MKGCWSFSITLCIVLVCVYIPAHACDVPVHQYAIINWPPDNYSLVVFHDPSQSDINALGDVAADEANVVVETVEVNDSMDAAMRTLFESSGGSQSALPWAVLRYPDTHNSLPIWSGPYNAANLARLLSSPVRAELAKNLVAGVMGHWILLESSNADANASAKQTLQSTLETIASQPTADGAQPRFTWSRIAHADPSEEATISMLIHSEPDLAGSDEPMLFPVYGRGRVLYALVGAGISEKMITKAAGFLLSDCSCEVKAENPGCDLLIAASWNVAVNPELALPLMPGITDAALLPGSDSAVKDAPAFWSTAMGRRVRLGIGVMVVLDGCVLAWLWRRRVMSR